MIRVGDDYYLAGTTMQMFDQTDGTTSIAATTATHLWLRVSCNFDSETSVFSWSTDGQTFAPLGDPFVMAFQLITFQGVRLTLFHYNTEGRSGGYVDFDNFTVEEPRARGIEREVPVGKTVALVSGADGSILTADTQTRTLVNLPEASSNTVAPDARFHVVDLGKGRVALRTAHGDFLSDAKETVTLKDLAGQPPGDAESFQWINLMRGDTMLMSLINHRYLATRPNEPGTVAVSAAGPRPDRKGGACFRWMEVN